MKNPLVLLALIIITSCTGNSSDKTNTVDDASNNSSAYSSDLASTNESKSSEESSKLTEEELKIVGIYEVIVDNSGGETYILNPDRTSVWKFAGSQEKMGNWKASEGIITIITKGNSGDIEEVYVFRNGKYYNTLFEDRILKKIK